MKRFLLIFLALMMVVSLCACNNGSQTDDPTNSTEENASEESLEQILDIILDGASEYRIVRSESASENVSGAIISMRNSIRNITGVELKITSDLMAMSEGGNLADKKEIVIGNTYYSESATVLADCEYGNYIIRVCGNKIMIVAHDESMILKACTYFSDLALKYGSKGKFSISVSNLNTVRTGTKVLSALPRFEGTGTSQILDSGDGAYMLHVQKSNQNSFDKYREQIVSAGYSLYTSHSATGNEFYTYVNDEYTIHTYYRLYDRSIRAIVEPRGILPLTAPEAYETVTTPSLSMLGLEIDGNQIGLCLIFRLSNGHFMILDGGNNKEVYADRIYEKLVELAPDKNNIVVDAWFISHGHTDHAGGMIQVGKHYSKEITVKQFISNIPPNEKLLEINDLTTEANARNAMKSYSGAAFTKAHTGQVFYFADAKVEMLYTVEDIYPNKLADGNSASMVFRVTLGGQTIMCLGDEHTDSSSVLTSMYTNLYLKSDMVQVSHHGLIGATSSLYAQIQPDVALWPSGISTYNNKKGTENNQKLLSLVKDLYISGSKGVTLSLPYTLQNNKAESDRVATQG